MDLKNARSRYQQLPEHCLKSMFMRCTADSNEQLLDFGDAAACSVGYEALLSGAFGGNFQALLAWWRSQAVRVPD